MAARPYHPKTREVIPNIEDDLQREALRAAALKMVERVKTWLAGNKDRAIRDLKIEHFDLLAGDAVGAYLARRLEQAKTNPDIWNQLIGVKPMDRPFDDPVDDLGRDGAMLD